MGGTLTLRHIKSSKKVKFKYNPVHNVCTELLIQQAIVCKAHLACVVHDLLLGGQGHAPQLKIEIESRLQ